MLIDFDFIPLFLKLIMPQTLSFVHKKVGSFLFGSDPGKQSREALEAFGLTGELGGEDVLGLGSQQLTAQAGLQGALSRQATGQRSARSGLTGSGIEEGRFKNIQLTSQDALNRALINLRLQILMRRMGALSQVAGQPRQAGFVETAGPAAIAALAGG